MSFDEVSIWVQVWFVFFLIFETGGHHTWQDYRIIIIILKCISDFMGR